jgi:nucleoside-diphosphate-sugar epimerase
VSVPGLVCVGARGTLGGLLVQRLGARGIEIRCPDPGDERGVPELADADVVVNVGGPRVRPGLTWVDYFREHVGVTTTVVRSMRPGARLVHVSSTAVYGARGTLLGPGAREAPTRFPSIAYACAKLAAEAIARTSGVERGLVVRVLRPSMVYGPGVDSALDTIRRLHRRGVRLRLRPERVRQHLLHVDLLVHAVERAVTGAVDRGERPLALADPVVVTNADLAPQASRWPAIDVDVSAAAALHDRWARTLGLAPGALEALAVLGLDNEFDVEPMVRVLRVDAGAFSRAATFDAYWGSRG